MGAEYRKDIGLEQVEFSDSRKEDLSGHYEKKQHKRSNSEKDYGIDDPIPRRLAKHHGQSGIETSKQTHTKSSKRTPLSRRDSTSKQSTYKNSIAMMAIVQKLVLSAGKSISSNPAVLLRTVLFLITIVLALSRHDVRDRLHRMIGLGWENLRRTVGMGIKVSYI